MKEAVFTLLRKGLAQLRPAQRLPLSVHRSIAIGQKATATVLEVNGQLLLLGVTSSAVTLIDRLDRNVSWEVKGVVR